MKTLALLRLSVLLLLAVAWQLTARADPFSEMAGFSVFGKVNPAELASGNVKTAAGPPMSTPRYMSVQSCFIVPKSPAQVVEAMKRFDPTAYRDLKVFLHSDLSSSPSAANFASLQSPPNNPAISALTAATKKMSPELQLSQAEVKKFSLNQPVFAFWTDVLTARAQDFARGGAGAEAPYEHAGPAIHPGRELAGLVKQQGAVNRQFSSFLGSTGLMGGRGSLRPELYWELLQVEDIGVITLGASYNRSSSGGGYQVADGLYYASGGYYVSLTLYQLWPIDLAGRPSTLVWRGDFVSAPSLGDLHGVERLASEGAMKKSISKAVTIFQRENSR